MYIGNYLMAHRIYEEFKNIQVGTTLERLIEVLEEIKNLGLKQLQTKDLQHVITRVNNSYDICYGCLEMLRAMQILRHVDLAKNNVTYEITALGEYLIDQKKNSFGFDMREILKNLDSVKILLKFVEDHQEVNALESKEVLGEEMKYYNKILLGSGKDYLKPFNEPISQMLLDLLVEFRVLQKNPASKKYFL